VHKSGLESSKAKESVAPWKRGKRVGLRGIVSAARLNASKNILYNSFVGKQSERRAAAVPEFPSLLFNCHIRHRESQPRPSSPFASFTRIMDALREGISEKNFAQARDAFGSLPASLLEDDKWALEVDEFGETILQKAANAGEEDIMRLLITKLKNESLILATYALS
jgi:hypothetical protein